ncbi:MAG: serine--tRNA ligase [Candidatus Colwellbacteria bacterium CG10_big_fil_rev_8_21_14_0_10_41_28]|uniref:Serine--tRNA ligase n=1 Tax=Candidatus Colwellbacteria bacterium CG10_big_fil_rev_8_21_14_0_10_41_28 TaxID=1974539 RepID=A0A2H0VJX5_9BACT|nr:MAG: serine--tRNA ligase [Candidatus Colwellbacteria bacterium CG10_big_fil_rev_8_21_14_0_10_41_28]
MLDPNFIRENKEVVAKGVQKRGGSQSLTEDFIKTDESWRNLITEVEGLRADKNKLGKDDREESKKLKERIKEIEDKLKDIENKRIEFLSKIPNVPEERAPVGKDEEENVAIREVGKPTKFSFDAKSYLDLAHNMIDIEKAAEVSGSRFAYIMGDLVLLEFALVRFVFDKLSKYGFVPVVPPTLIKSDVMRKMGKTKFIEEGDAFYVSEDDLYLVGTAEDTIGPLHMNQTLGKEDLPIRYVGFSSAFRREAGSYGKDAGGILRVHQFDKVEMFSFTEPTKSIEENDFLLERQEDIMKDLGLPYQVVHICTGDMGFTATNQFDIETWIPSEGRYRETHSCSNTTDYQARGLNIKFNPGDGEKTEYVHMLNATGLAIGRTLIAIIENYQTKDGNIMVPRALKKYVGKKEIKGLQASN